MLLILLMLWLAYVACEAYIRQVKLPTFCKHHCFLQEKAVNIAVLVLFWYGLVAKYGSDEHKVVGQSGRSTTLSRAPQTSQVWQ